MIPTHTARQSVLRNSVKEEVKNRLGTVVVAHTDPGNQAGLSIDEAVNNDLEAYQTWRAGE
jgi:hypothetical protein